MTNLFNQSRYRNEHELGSAYKLVSEVREQLYDDIENPELSPRDKKNMRIQDNLRVN